MSTHNNHKSSIDEELVSVDSLKHVLCTRCSCKHVSIHREVQDPPDFTVTIDGDTFPVEVTSIVSDQQYHAHCKEFARAINNRAVDMGILSGMYRFLVIHHPQIPKPTSTIGYQIIDSVITYIMTTLQEDTATETLLLEDSMGKISIEKVSPTGSLIDLARISSKWEGDYQNELVSLIQQAIDIKKRKLQDIGVKQQEALLLLYDAFNYAEPEDALIAMEQVKGYDWFHSIFWAASFFDRENSTYFEEPGRDGLFLFSLNPDWNKNSNLNSFNRLET